MESLNRRIQQWLWPPTLPHSPLELTLLKVSRFGYALVRDLSSGDLTLRAMSLVYTTMLAIVPLLAFSFAVLKALGFHQTTLEPLLASFLAPLGPSSAEITANIIGFVDNVSGSTLAGVSLLLLLFTALSMAQKVEDAFNFVWRVDRPRSLGRRFSEYVSVMLIGPALMSVAMGMTGSVASTTVVTRLQQIEPFGTLIVFWGQLTPYILVAATFTFLYTFVPNTSVRIRSALLGGILAGVAWAAIGGLFAQFVVGATRTEAIYSGFAIVIVAMLWLYASWLILLVGAQFTFYHQNPDYLNLGWRKPTASNELRERLAISTMLLVGRDFDEPAHGWRVPSVAAKVGAPRHLLEPVVGALRAAGLLEETADQKLIPARDLRRITLAEIVAVVRSPGACAEVNEPDHWNPTVRALTNQVNSAIAGTLSDRTLADLVDEDEGQERSA